ncbi:MAG: transcriptional regulator [Kofleriaceae bacterium]|nr:MAG: transcriptional regulator [Kofleriaceae bacterium]MBZ0231760.1 transcriptional regulator [Kofleriaceae bacterium]
MPKAKAQGGSAATQSSRRADSQQLVRQWALLRLLSGAGRAFSVKELAEQLDVSKATVQRDLATLERDFALVDEIVGEQKRMYRVDQHVRALESLTFGITELLALHGALAGMASLRGTPIHDDLRAVMLKIRGFLSPRHNGGLDAIARVFTAHARGYVDHGSQAELIDQLADAISRRRRCVMTYHAAWKGTTRRHVVKPLRLVWHRSALYLLGCLGDHRRISTLAVQRIQQLEVTAETFAVPRVDVDAHVRRAFGIFVSDAEEDVEIRFAKEIAWRVEERTYAPGERKQRLPDGSLRYRVRTSAQWEVIPWVLGFGSLAELVRPESWRTILRTTCAATLANY